jgi:GPH family glycoside/pentoside/hexuronide:cation symporter
MSQRLTAAQKWIYGSGDTGFSLTSTIIGAYFAIFLTDVVGIAPAVAAAAIFIGRSWDYINDPLIGWISDRTRTRWGRRRPFLLFGAIPFGLIFTLMWIRPAIEDQVLLTAYYAVVYVLFDAAATFVYMPYFALTPELAEGYDDRTSLTTHRMFFSILGSLIAFTIPLVIIGSFSPENAPRVFLMAVIFAVVSALPLWLVFWGTRERETFMHSKPPKLLASLKAAFKNKLFVFGALIYLLTWVAMDILQVILLYYIKYVVAKESQSDLIMAAIFVTALICLPFWLWVSKRWNKRVAYIAGVAFWAAVQLTLMSLTASISLPLLMVLCVLAGIGVSAAHVLPWSIFPDAVEWDEWQTGERHEGTFYSLLTLAQKIASSIAIPLTLVILDLTGYIPNSAVQPQTALTGIRLIIGPIPALLLLGGILLSAFYPLNREQFQKILAELEERRALRAAKPEQGGE